MRKQSTLKELCYEYSEDDLLCPPNEQIAADCLVRIFDEFAIDFAKNVLINHGKFKYVDLEKMLVVYKKEKGL
jgi:hypothetical protein